MLESFRNASQTWVIKILFAFLILSFGVWGVGDVVRQRVESTPAISVGDKSYSPAEVADRFRRDVDRMGSMFGSKLTTEQALQFGLLNQTVQRLVEGALLDQAAKKQNIGVDDDTLRRQIAEIPAFQSQLKMFDKTTYLRVLASMNMSEKQFIALERDDLARGMLLKLITGGTVAPVTLAAPLYRYQSEKRVADSVTFAADKMPAPPNPDAETLRKYYDTHKSQFQQPELRAITALVIHAADLAAAVQISDDDIDKAYQARLGEFQTNETRKVEQILFPDQAQAQAFYDKAKSAADFAALVKQSGQSLIDLGTVTKAEMPLAELSDAAFGAATGIIGPVQSTLGWHVLRVAIVTKGSTKPLAEVRNEIVAALVKDQVTNQLYTLSTKIEDSIGGGNDVADTAKAMGFKAIHLDAVDDHGRDANGQAINSPAVIPPVIATAFQTVTGGTSEVAALPNNDGYYVLHVDKVTPGTVKPYEQVQAQLLGVWQTEQRSAEARRQADALAEKLRKGGDIAALAAPFKVETTKPFQRNGGAQVAPLLAAEIFRLPAVGAVTVVANGADAVVARLKEIRTEEAEGAGFDAARNQASQTLSEDLMQEYLASLRKQIGATINMAAITQQFGK